MLACVRLRKSSSHNEWHPGDAFSSLGCHPLSALQMVLDMNESLSSGPGLTLRSGSVNAFEGYSINKFSENKDLGVLWLEHIVSPEVQKLVAVNWGRPPSLLSTFEDAEVAEKSPQFATVLAQGEYPSPRYGSPFYFDLGTVFNQHMLSLINDEVSPQEAIDLIQAQGQTLIDEYWANAA